MSGKLKPSTMKVGSVVRDVDSRRPMTVIKFVGYSLATCEYSDAGTRKEVTFPVDMLVVLKP
jgi:hypothetical protein